MCTMNIIDYLWGMTYIQRISIVRFLKKKQLKSIAKTNFQQFYDFVEMNLFSIVKYLKACLKIFNIHFEEILEQFG